MPHAACFWAILATSGSCYQAFALKAPVRRRDTSALPNPLNERPYGSAKEIRIAIEAQRRLRPEKLPLQKGELRSPRRKPRRHWDLKLPATTLLESSSQNDDSHRALCRPQSQTRN